MSLSLSIACPSMGGHEEAVTTWQDTMSKPWPVRVYDQIEGDEAGFLTKCDKAWRETDAKVVGFLHSDLFIHEYDFDRRVLAEFTKPDVAVVGFVGATRLGHPDIYKVPYDYRQLARADVWSNLTDAEAHGKRDSGVRRVSVVDSCAVFARRSLLERLGGWPIHTYPNSSHCSDLWLCLSAHRLGFQSVMVGVSATHRSGGKGEAGSAWLGSRGGDAAGFHQPSHVVTYETFRDVLPLCV